MNTQQLPKLVEKSAKRLGRGIGSGKGGHTSGRGNKGQKARGKVSIHMEGTKFKKSLIKRLPLLRGKGKLKPWKSSAAITLKDLQAWPEKSVVNMENLIKNGFVDTWVKQVKIIGNFEIKRALNVDVLISKKAAEIVEKAGGKINR